GPPVSADGLEGGQIDPRSFQNATQSQFPKARDGTDLVSRFARSARRHTGHVELWRTSRRPRYSDEKITELLFGRRRCRPKWSRSDVFSDRRTAAFQRHE